MQFDAVQEAIQVWRKLFERRNWLLGVPYVATTLLMVAIFFAGFAAAIGPGFFRAIVSGNAENWQPDASLFLRFALLWCIGFVVLLVVATLVNAWTLAAADNVWRRGDPAFDRAFNRAVEKLAPLVAFSLLIGLIGIVSIITIVGPIVIAYLAIYGYVFILFGDKSATEAIAASFKLASEQVAPTIILVLAFIAIAVAGFALQFIFAIPTALLQVAVGLAGPSFSWLWFVVALPGWLVQLAVNLVLYGYMALGTVRFYDLLKSSPSTIPIVPPTSV